MNLCNHLSACHNQYAPNPLVLAATNAPQLPASPSYIYHPPLSQFITASVLPSTSSPVMQTSPFRIQPMQSTPGFPSSIPGKFMVYLLQFCPRQTSTCFGCGNPLKQGAVIPDPKFRTFTFIALQRAFNENSQILSSVLASSLHKLSLSFYHFIAITFE